MRTSQKAALTILISFLFTGLFAVFAYTGFFSLLDIGFFSERVKSDQISRLELAIAAIDSWNADNLSRFDAIARDGTFQSSYSLLQRENDITARERAADSLEDRLEGFQGLRIVDSDGRIQYSTYAGDISTQVDGGRRLYRNWDQVSDRFELPPIGTDPQPFVIYDGVRQRLLYGVPSMDRALVIRGWLIAAMRPSGLAEVLAAGGRSTIGAQVLVVDGKGLLIDVRSEQLVDVESVLNELWASVEEPASFAPLASAGNDSYWLVSAVAENRTLVGRLVPGRLLGFSSFTRFLLIASVFVTAALASFLLLNIRQDRTEVLRGRLKKLQANLIKDWLEHHEDRKLRLADLESRREEVSKELLNGLGNFKGNKLKEADKIIDAGWSSIVEILAETDAPSSEPARGHDSPPVDMKQLEDMITRAIAGARIAVPSPVQTVEPPVTPPGYPIASSVVEEGLEEIPEAEPVDEVEELEEIPEAESVEELEEVAEAEEILEDEPEDLEPLTEAEAEVAEGLEEENNDSGEEPASPLEIHDDVDMLEELASVDIPDELEPENDEEVLEVLPVVLSDDTRKLIEIGKVSRDRLYMFEKEFDGPNEDPLRPEISGAEEMDETSADIDDVEELEELEELDELDDVEDEEESEIGGSEVLIAISDILDRVRAAESSENPAESSSQSVSASMESLIKTRTRDILPGAGEFALDDHAPVLTWGEAGLEYDRYLKGFKKGATGIYKSLMTLSKEYGAICGVLLAASRKGLDIDYAVGLDDETATALSVDHSEEAWGRWFQERNVIFVPRLSASLYAGKTKNNDFRYIRSALFVPVTYHDSEAYIFLGFKEAPKDPVSLLASSASLV